MNKKQVEIYNKIISKYNFNEKQKFQIGLGLQKNLKVSLYSKPNFSYEQMQEIRLGLENNLDVSIYSNTKYSWRQMEQIRFCLYKKFRYFLVKQR